MLRLLGAFAVLWLASGLTAPASADPATMLATHAEEIAKPSRRAVGPVIEAIGAVEGGAEFIAAWADRRVGQWADGGLFLFRCAASSYALTDPVTGAPAGEVPRADLTEIRPDAGVRAAISSVRVRFQLNDPDPLPRRAALASLARDGHAEPRRTHAEVRAALEANIVAGRAGGIPVAQLDTEPARERAWEALEAEGKVPPP